MPWPSFLQFIFAVILGAWLRGGFQSLVPEPLRRLAEAIAERGKGKNHKHEMPELPRTGV